MPAEEKKVQTMEEILVNEECLKKIYAAQNDEEIRQVFREKGLELDEEQMESLKQLFKEALQEVEKLSSQELEYISGGKLNTEYIKDNAAAGLGIGGATGIGIGATIGGMYALIETLIKSKTNDGFLKNYSKIIAKTAAAAAMTGAIGAGIGGSIGGLAGMADSGHESTK